MNHTNHPRFRWSDRLFRQLVLRKLARLPEGSLTLSEVGAAALVSLGTQPSPRRSNLSAEVRVREPRFYRRIALGGALGAAESLMDGDWECDNLTAFTRIFIQQLDVLDAVDGSSPAYRRWIERARHWWRSNTVAGARRNIADHYDLGNDFYSLWLDETMNYSCGIFTGPQDTLQDASVAKMDRICRLLQLQPEDHLVEIGGGWGALAIHAAEHFGCRVTTTTISPSQYECAITRVRERGLTERVRVLMQDYRHLQGRFDKLVSVEMIEAVGHRYYSTYFQKCSALLRDGGQMLLQAIVIADEQYQKHIRSVDFISQYIFPGGSLPAISVLVREAAAAGGMRLLRLDDFAWHYAETLRRWRTNFDRCHTEVRELGFDERFIRMWQYYLSYCEAAFEERQVNVAQMLFAKRPPCSTAAGVAGSSIVDAAPSLPPSPAPAPACFDEDRIPRASVDAYREDQRGTPASGAGQGRSMKRGVSPNGACTTIDGESFTCKLSHAIH